MARALVVSILRHGLPTGDLSTVGHLVHAPDGDHVDLRVDAVEPVLAKPPERAALLAQSTAHRVVGGGVSVGCRYRPVSSGRDRWSGARPPARRPVAHGGWHRSRTRGGRATNADSGPSRNSSRSSSSGSVTNDPCTSSSSRSWPASGRRRRPPGAGARSPRTRTAPRRRRPSGAGRPGGRRAPGVQVVQPPPGLVDVDLVVLQRRPCLGEGRARREQQRHDILRGDHGHDHTTGSPPMEISRCSDDDVIFSERCGWA